MQQYVTALVLAGTVGMCATTRPVTCVVLTSVPSITAALPTELRLPLGKCDPEETVEALATLLNKWNIPADVQTDMDARAERFHELVDREFLGVLTSAEEQELEILTRWRDEMKSAFYQTVVAE